MCHGRKGISAASKFIFGSPRLTALPKLVMGLPKMVKTCEIQSCKRAKGLQEIQGRKKTAKGNSSCHRTGNPSALYYRNCHSTLKEMKLNLANEEYLPLLGTLKKTPRIWEVLWSMHSVNPRKKKRISVAQGWYVESLVLSEHGYFLANVPLSNWVTLSISYARNQEPG